MSTKISNSVSRYCGPLGIWGAYLIYTCQAENVNSWFSDHNVTYVHKGRVAIRHAADLLVLSNEDEILFPSYNCGSEIDPLLKICCKILLYRIDNKACVDISDLEAKITKKTKAVYITHFFGFSPDIEIVRKLCDLKKLFLIEDCALSLLSSHNTQKLGTFGDIAIFSFPKTLPVPDGGALVINNPALESSKSNLQRPSCMPILKNLLPLSKASVLRTLARRTGKSSIIEFLAGLRVAERSAIDDSTMRQMPDDYFFNEAISNTAISSFTQHMLSHFSQQNIIEQRRRNFLTYMEALKNSDIIDPLYPELPPGVCPLSFPVIVPARNRIYAKLTTELIAVTPWWAGYHPSLPWDKYPDACFLKDNLLTLPVHQQLNTEDVFFIVDRLLKNAR